MQENTKKFSRFVQKMPNVLEKVVAAVLLLAVAYGCVQLVMLVLGFNAGDLESYIDSVMATAFSVIIVIEFIRMLVKHSMNTIIEVLIFAIARSFVAQHEEPLLALVHVVAIAILLLCRKFLFHEFDFHEEE